MEIWVCTNTFGRLVYMGKLNFRRPDIGCYRNFRRPEFESPQISLIKILGLTVEHLSRRMRRAWRRVYLKEFFSRRA